MASELRRCAGEEIDNAIKQLTEGVASDPVDAIHDARKSLKKERSLLRLARGTLEPAARRRENAAFREVGQSLSATRDADVMVEALDELAERYAGQLPQPVFAAIRERLGGEQETSRAQLAEGATDHAVEALRAARARIEEWPLRRDGWDALDAGLVQGYSRGRRALKPARKKPTVENLHEWRKRVKDLWYHVRLLEPALPQTMRGHADDAHRLSDLLGDDHDLAVLAQAVADRAPDLAVDTDAVLGAIEHRREQLQAEAFSLGARLYAERPKAFRRRISRYWKGWRSEVSARAAQRPAELADVTR